MRSIGVVNVLGFAIFYVVLFNVVSAVAITADILLGLKEQLGGNVAATVVSCIILVRFSKGVISFSNKRVVILFAVIAGLSSVAFLGSLHIASEMMDSYDVSAVTSGEAIAVFVFNGLIFLGTVFFLERGSKKNADP